MVIVAGNNATSASRAVVNSWNPTALGAERDDVKQLCIKMYLNGMGLRGIERVTDIHHTTVMHWIRETGEQLRSGPRVRGNPRSN